MHRIVKVLSNATATSCQTFFFYKKSAPFSKSRHTSLRNSFKSFFKIIKNKMFFLYVARLSKSEIDVPSQLHVSESKK